MGPLMQLTVGALVTGCNPGPSTSFKVSASFCALSSGMLLSDFGMLVLDDLDGE